MSLSLDCDVARGTYLRGDITVRKGATVEQNVRLVDNVTVEKKAKVGADGKLAGDVTVGRYTSLNGENYVVGSVDIGQFCAIAPRAIVWANNHATDDWAMQNRVRSDINVDWEVEDGPVRVGSDVWMGIGSMILPDVDVGTGACIGASSVVTKDVAPYEIFAGNPAERIG